MAWRSSTFDDSGGEDGVRVTHGAASFVGVDCKLVADQCNRPGRNQDRQCDHCDGASAQQPINWVQAVEVANGAAQLAVWPDRRCQ